MREMDKIIRELQDYSGPEIRLMEVCGTHTVSIFKNGIKSLLSPQIRLVSGPGCPVCVTPAAYIDAAVELAQKPGYALLTFGDMIKVPGSRVSLGDCRAEGGRVEVIYSPLEALAAAKKEPNTVFVLAAIGFETTIPAYCMLLEALEKEKIGNVRLLSALRRLMPALEWIEENGPRVHGYICPGHVSAIIGEQAYQPFACRFHKPMAIAGFSAEHLLLALYHLTKQVAAGAGGVKNLYPAVVSKEGNETALKKIARYFTPQEARWRGLGLIRDSGYLLRDEYAVFKSGLEDWEQREEPDNAGACRCGEVITGKLEPAGCAAFGSTCTPHSPLGPCMVSSEGTCSIWYRHGGMKT